MIGTSTGLAELGLETEYRSDERDLVSEFYVPCLERSQTYRRAVGYFTSSSLSVAAQGLTTFLGKGGVVQLVASPQLLPEDVEAMQRGYTARENVIERALLRSLESVVAEELSEDIVRLSVLAWLIAEQKLDVRIAYRSDSAGIPVQGIYHEKIGIFSDEFGNHVAFGGSPNETAGGLIHNFESMDVFWSWGNTAERVHRKISNFKRLWTDETATLTVVDLPEAVRRRLLEFKSAQRPSSESRAREKITALGPHPWPHQKRAVEKFLECRQGILEMATGTGKTYTALLIAERLVRAGCVESIVIAADGNDLLEQWRQKLDDALSRSFNGFRLLRQYWTNKEGNEFTLAPRHSVLLISRDALSPFLVRAGTAARSRMLLIHDEVHSLGSPANIRRLDGLSDEVPYRLGLSATPERPYDEEGNKFIERHIGPVVYRYELADAIQDGVLCEFDYIPLSYRPSNDDRAALQVVFRRRSAAAREGKPMSDAEFRRQLAWVHKISRAKLPPLQVYLQQNPSVLEQTIIFVADHELGHDIAPIIHAVRHDYHTYYSDDERRNLTDFAAGKISCLISCHKLSEGIDIRSVRNVILVSSDRAPLETIQRIGRCLRTDPSAPEKRARVIDFIRTVEEESGADEMNPDQEREEWLTELSRVRFGGGTHVEHS